MHAEMMKDFERLADRLREICGNSPVYYLANQGNLGDALIRYGSLKFFRHFDLPHREIRSTARTWRLPSLRRPVLIYGGGGAWCELYNRSSMLQSLQKKYKIVVLPSTYAQSRDYPPAIYFRRDQCESAAFQPESEFCHDMAFFIDDEFRKMEAGQESRDGFFFRTDAESTHGVPLPASNHDISLQGRAYDNILPFLARINSCSRIFTDRLHVAIAACLLGKETHLYPNSYFKNHAVYLSSMRDYFENITFHQDFDTPWSAGGNHA